MLTDFEKVAFLFLAVLAIGATVDALWDVWRVINRGEGRLALNDLLRRAFTALRIYITQSTTLKTRRISSLFHLGIVWGFTFYFLVNALDVLIGFIPGFEESFKETGALYQFYSLAADLLSVAVLVGVSYFILRRFVLPNKRELTFHDNVLLHPKVKAGGIAQDSLIVATFILLHVGARFLGEAVLIAQGGAPVWYMPFASLVAPLYSGMSPEYQELLRHLFWWTALGGILLFAPYFAQSKHAHLFMAPLNYLTKPDKTSPGEMQPINLEDESVEQFGVARFDDLPKTNIFDAYACIQCNRCQDVCPAYITGKELSPSALEINKRYLLRDNQAAYADGAEMPFLLNMAISESAVWACTSCGACIEVCPVGNEPMHDILNIRRNQVLMESSFPEELGAAFNGMERQGNPWNIGESRFRWANGLEFPVPTVDENPDFEILYWVGCAASYDPRAQLTARALVKVLHTAGVNFAVLGERENCTGDVARRAGNEYLYQELAKTNVETLNEVKPPRIVVTCPHCLHNLGSEYHQFGGNYEVVHHTQLIEELITAGRVPANAHPKQMPNVTFHDPCYLGRHNGVIEEPRNVLTAVGITPIEMPRTKDNSLCCGAGGAQFWKEEEHGTKAVNVERYEEAKHTGADVVAVGCPFCMQMFESAKSEVSDGPVVKDIVEIIAEGLNVPSLSGD